VSPIQVTACFCFERHCDVWDSTRRMKLGEGKRQKCYTSLLKRGTNSIEYVGTNRDIDL